MSSHAEMPAQQRLGAELGFTLDPNTSTYDELRMEFFQAMVDINKQRMSPKKVADASNGEFSKNSVLNWTKHFRGFINNREDAEAYFKVFECTPEQIEFVIERWKAVHDSKVHADPEPKSSDRPSAPVRSWRWLISVAVVALTLTAFVAAVVGLVVSERVRAAADAGRGMPLACFVFTGILLVGMGGAVGAAVRHLMITARPRPDHVAEITAPQAVSSPEPKRQRRRPRIVKALAALVDGAAPASELDADEPVEMLPPGWEPPPASEQIGRDLLPGVGPAPLLPGPYAVRALRAREYRMPWTDDPVGADYVCAAFLAVGVALPATSREQAAAGIEVPLEQLQPGDVVIYDEGDHSGVYLSATHVCALPEEQNTFHTGRRILDWPSEPLRTPAAERVPLLLAIEAAMQWRGAAFAGTPTAFVQQVFQDAGVELPMTAFKMSAMVVALEHLACRPGDILITAAGNIGIHVGANKLVYLEADGQVVTRQLTPDSMVEARRVTFGHWPDHHTVPKVDAVRCDVAVQRRMVVTLRDPAARAQRTPAAAGDNADEGEGEPAEPSISRIVAAVIRGLEVAELTGVSVPAAARQFFRSADPMTASPFQALLEQANAAALADLICCPVPTDTAVAAVMVPSFGDMVTEVQVLEWLKAVGDHVEAKEALVRLHTGTVTLNIPAPAGGRLIAITAPAGTSVALDGQLGAIGIRTDTNPGTSETLLRRLSSKSVIMLSSNRSRRLARRIRK